MNTSMDTSCSGTSAFWSGFGRIPLFQGLHEEVEDARGIRSLR